MDPAACGVEWLKARRVRRREEVEAQGSSTCRLKKYILFAVLSLPDGDSAAAAPFGYIIRELSRVREPYDGPLSSTVRRAL